jgi:hypothetical protein
MTTFSWAPYWQQSSTKATVAVSLQVIADVAQGSFSYHFPVGASFEKLISFFYVVAEYFDRSCAYLIVDNKNKYFYYCCKLGKQRSKNYQLNIK